MEKQLKSLDNLKEKSQIILKNKITWKHGTEEHIIHVLKISDRVKVIQAQLELNAMVSNILPVIINYVNKISKASDTGILNESDDYTKTEQENDDYTKNLVFGKLILSHNYDLYGCDKALNEIKMKIKKYIVFENKDGVEQNINDEIINLFDIETFYIVSGGIINYFLD